MKKRILIIFTCFIFLNFLLCGEEASILSMDFYKGNTNRPISGVLVAESIERNNLAIFQKSCLNNSIESFMTLVNTYNGIGFTVEKTYPSMFYDTSLTYKEECFWRVYYKPVNGLDSIEIVSMIKVEFDDYFKSRKAEKVRIGVFDKDYIINLYRQKLLGLRNRKTYPLSKSITNWEKGTTNYYTSDLEVYCYVNHLNDSVYLDLVNAKSIVLTDRKKGGQFFLSNVELLSKTMNKLGSLKNLEKITIRIKGLDYFPSKISGFENLKYVSIDQTEFTKVPESIIEFEGVNYLSFHSFKRKVNIWPIMQLKGLKHLSLICEVENESGKLLSSLTLEELSIRAEKKIPNFFLRLPSLRLLSIDAGGVEMKLEGTYYSKLNKLELKNGSVNKRNSNCGYMPNVKELILNDFWIYGDYLTECFENIDEIVMTAKSNYMMDISTISFPIGLSKMSIYHYQFDKIPRNIYTLQGLMTLYLENNGIKSLESSLSEFKSIDELVIFDRKSSLDPLKYTKFDFLKIN